MAKKLFKPLIMFEFLHRPLINYFSIIGPKGVNQLNQLFPLALIRKFLKFYRDIPMLNKNVHGNFSLSAATITRQV